MPSFTRHAFSAMDDSNLVLEVVDARFVDMMRNHDVEYHLKLRKIPVIVVLNKMDLLMGKTPDYSEMKKEGIPFVPISCAPKRNINRLRTLIFSLMKEGGTITVMGYPNTGKSSVINALTGRHAAPTSKQAGFTKGKSKVRLKEDVYIWDTPGIIPLDEYDPFTLMLFGAKSPNQLKDTEVLAMKLLEWLPTHPFWSDWSFRMYGIVLKGDGEEQLEQLALHWKKVRKGGFPDLHASAIKLIHDWQSGFKSETPKST
jgi:ribosome biogenesis GTPase A